MSSYQLHLGLDYGTANWSLAFAAYRDGEKVAGPTRLILYDSAYEVRSMATWTADGRFVRGKELERLSLYDAKLSDNVLEHFKLGLYQSKSNDELVAKFERILTDMPGNHTLEDLITEHLRAIIALGKVALKPQLALLQLTDEECSTMLESIRVRITIPQMWTPSARRTMQVAAKRAGLKVSLLAAEPQAALSWLINRFALWDIAPHKKMGKGSHILVCDIGAGTGDFVMYALQNALNAESALQAVGQSSGSLCGSTHVDRILLKQLLSSWERPKKIRICKKLGITERDFERRVLFAIEEIKRSFDPEIMMLKKVVTIYGCGEAKKKHHEVELQFEDVQEALDTVILQITSEIDSQIDMVKPSKVEMMAVVGGFSKSSYLLQKLRSRYQPMGIIIYCPSEDDADTCQPIAVGALMRYDNITPSNLPVQYHYAMLERAHFDEVLHVDSYTTAEDGTITQKPWVKRSPYDKNVDIVEDRLRIIIKKDTVLLPGQVTTADFQQWFFTPIQNPHISGEFVFLTEDFKEHDSAMVFESEGRRGEEDKYKLREGVHAWASVVIDLRERKLEDYGYKITTVTTGQSRESFYEVPVRAFIKNYAGNKMRVGYDILRPSKKRNADGDLADFQGRIAFTVIDSVFDAKHSEFIS